MTILAQAYLDANEVEQACEVSRGAMDLASGVGSVRPRERVAAFVQGLAPYRTVSSAAELTAYAAERASQSRSTLAPTRDIQPGRPR